MEGQNIKVENIDVYNIHNAVLAMRNPYGSWSKSDTKGDEIGIKDLELVKKLVKGGPEHRKFLRQIFVSMEITAPVYWWQEFDTYKVGVTRNSWSFMHRGLARKLGRDDFAKPETEEAEVILDRAIEMINELIELVQINPDDKDARAIIFRDIRKLVPMGYLYRSTVTMNYENVYNMIHQREHHRLPEWQDFCKMLKTLPFVESFI